MAALALAALSAGCASSGVEPPRGAKPVQRVMTVTAYCDCGKCCNWKRNWRFKPIIASGPHAGRAKDVGRTASGVYAEEGRTIAADTSRYPFGTVIDVPGYGMGRVEDRGSAIQGERLDVFFDDLEWGVRKLPVTVWMP